MAATTGFRTLYPAIIPPGTVHVDPVTSAGSIRSNWDSVLFGAGASSFITDFFVRASGVGDIRASVVETLPLHIAQKLQSVASTIFLRLNCLTSIYAPLWKEITSEPWTKETPFRKSRNRQNAQNEIDAIVALSLGVTADELCMIYRTQFPVMRRYDLEDHFDRNGRKVPKEVMTLHRKMKDGEELTQEQRTWIHPQSGIKYLFEYPFQVSDREKDLRAAYSKHQEVLLEN